MNKIFLTNNNLTYYLGDNFSPQALLSQWVQKAPQSSHLDYQQAMKTILKAIDNPNSTDRMVKLSGLKDLPDCVTSLFKKGGPLEGCGLDVHECQIRELPENFELTGDLILGSDSVVNDFLTSLPKGLRVHGNLFLGITSVSFIHDIHVEGNLRIEKSPYLKSVRDLYVGGDVSFSSCPIQILCNIQVMGKLNLAYVNELTVIENISVGTDLEIIHADITELPLSVCVTRSVIVEHCNKLEIITLKHTNFSGDFIIHHCPKLKTLPETLTVRQS